MFRRRQLTIHEADYPHPMQRFFEGWRKMRRDHYAERPSREGAHRSRAVIVMAKNEPVFFPIWLRYYSRFFAPEDIYVLDHETSDGSLDGTGFVRIPVTHDRIDHTWMVERLAELQHELLERYEVVLTTDVDEIVIPTPERGDLGSYIDHLDEEFVNAIGYELVHLPDREPPIDLGRPILDQRQHWFANDAYDKPCLSMVPTTWKPGLHERLDAETNFDPDLRLIHLHRMDYETCRVRHRTRRQNKWQSRDVKEGWAAHYRLRSKRRFDRWYFERSGVEEEGIVMELQRIPEQWRGAF